MNRVRFRIACGVLAVVFGGGGVAGAVDAVKSQVDGARPGSAGASGATSNADAANKSAEAAKPEVAKPGVAEAGTTNADATKAEAKKARAKKTGVGNIGPRQPGAHKARREAKKAAEAKKQAEAKKAAAAKRAAATKKSAAAPKTGSASAASKTRPVGGIQLARIAAPGSKVIGTRTIVDCRLQTLLPAAVAERNSKIVLTDLPAGKVLTLKIVDIEARSGGFFSGRKGITVEGRLLEAGKLRGTFTAKESSLGSVSNCGMLENAIRELAGDIGAWVDRPAMNSRLGNTQ